MATLKFKTNINCTGCLSKVTPVLDQEKGIENWGVDLESKERFLTVKTTLLNVESIIQAVNSAGYKAEII